jgi:hypothetical protein
MTIINARDFLDEYCPIGLRNIKHETAIDVANSLRDEIVENYRECRMEDWEDMIDHYKLDCETEAELAQLIKKMKKMVFS